jgi:2-iminobutanoate/2-iminopropanoate deaminase
MREEGDAHPGAAHGTPRGIPMTPRCQAQEETSMTKIEKTAAKSVYDPPTYSQAIRVTGAQTLVFVSGQVAYDQQGAVLHPGDFKAQARETFRSVVEQVQAAGGTVQSIVKLNTYLTDVRHRGDLVPIREEIFGKRLPASTLVGVTALAQPGWMIEVEAIAAI